MKIIYPETQAMIWLQTEVQAVVELALETASLAIHQEVLPIIDMVVAMEAIRLLRIMVV